MTKTEADTLMEPSDCEACRGRMSGEDRVELAAEDITHVLAVADAKIFHKSYGDQNGELWSPSGRLLATTTQIAYFKA